MYLSILYPPESTRFSYFLKISINRGFWGCCSSCKHVVFRVTNCRGTVLDILFACGLLSGNRLPSLGSRELDCTRVTVNNDFPANREDFRHEAFGTQDSAGNPG